MGNTPQRQGTSWSRREEELLEAFVKFTSAEVKELADYFQRSIASIAARLLSMGLILPDNATPELEWAVSRPEKLPTTALKHIARKYQLPDKFHTSMAFISTAEKTIVNAIKAMGRDASATPYVHGSTVGGTCVNNARIWVDESDTINTFIRTFHMNKVNVKKAILINGVDSDKISVDDLLDHLEKLNAEVTRLKDLNVRSTFVDGEIKDTNKAKQAIVKILDMRKAASDSE